MSTQLLRRQPPAARRRPLDGPQSAGRPAPPPPPLTASPHRLPSPPHTPQSLVATLHLRRRQDLMARVLGLIWPGKDILDVEITLNEGAMAPAVLAVVAAPLAKQLQAEEEDLQVRAGAGGRGAEGARALLLGGRGKCQGAPVRRCRGAAWGRGSSRPAGSRPLGAATSRRDASAARTPGA